MRQFNSTIDPTIQPLTWAVYVAQLAQLPVLPNLIEGVVTARCASQYYNKHITYQYNTIVLYGFTKVYIYDYNMEKHIFWMTCGLHAIAGYVTGMRRKAAPKAATRWLWMKIKCGKTTNNKYTSVTFG